MRSVSARNADSPERPHNDGVSEASSAPQPGLTVAAVARRLGVAPATLRTWDRRYGLGPSSHEAGAHRRYTAVDLARLEHMRQLIVAGVPAADAAREALAADVDGAPLATVTPIGSRPQVQARIPEQVSARPGGGSVVALPGAGARARGLARAAMSLDGATCQAIIEDSLVDRGVIATWDDLLVPVLAGVGEKWQDDGKGIEVEHTLSGAVLQALGGVMRGLRDPINARSVLLAPVDGEWHSLPLWALAAALAERQIGCQLMTDPMPPHSLTQAVHRLGPAAVVVWSQTPETGDAAQVAGLPRFRPMPAVLLGGPGWHGALPAGVERVGDLTGAVARVAHALGE